MSRANLFKPPFEAADWHNISDASRDVLRAAASFGEHWYGPKNVSEIKGEAYYRFPTVFIRDHAKNQHYPEVPLTNGALSARLRHMRRVYGLVARREWMVADDHTRIRKDAVDFVRQLMLRRVTP